MPIAKEVINELFQKKPPGGREEPT